MTKEFKLEPRLVAKFLGNAQLAQQRGHAEGSYHEQIVSALLHSRPDWLPGTCHGVLDALTQLVEYDKNWFYTMIEMSRMELCRPLEMAADPG